METIDPVSKPSMPHSVAEPKFVRLQDYRLDDNLTCDSGRILISGTQALVRLTLMQARLDRARGWNTAGFVSGYRGSPWGQWIRHCGRRRPYWTKTRCASCRRSTKSWARRPHWEPSGWPVTRCDALRESSQCGTARGLVSIGLAMPCATAMPMVRPHVAGSLSWRGTITVVCRRVFHFRVIWR